MNIVVFDTETIGKVSQDLLNIGYKIVDIDIQKGTYKLLIERDYLVNDLINNSVYCINDDFVGVEKYGMYLTLLEQKKIIKHSLQKIFEIMRKDLEKYKVLFGYAYNNKFDIDKFYKSAEKYGIENPLNYLDNRNFDIWGYAYQYICSTEEYKTWAKENNVLTSTELYIQTSVEGVAKYLYNDLDFKEDHTALSDVQHELNILMECVRRGCDITRPAQKTGFIPSEKVFTKTIKLPNGEIHTFDYKKSYERNGTITYKE